MSTLLDLSLSMRIYRQNWNIVVRRINLVSELVYMNLKSFELASQSLFLKVRCPPTKCAKLRNKSVEFGSNNHIGFCILSFNKIVFNLILTFFYKIIFMKLFHSRSRKSQRSDRSGRIAGHWLKTANSNNVCRSQRIAHWCKPETITLEASEMIFQCKQHGQYYEHKKTKHKKVMDGGYLCVDVLRWNITIMKS